MMEVEKGPEAPPGSLVPQGRVSSLEYVDYHMILDSELTSLTQGEAGILGSFGFTFGGASLGLMPAMLAGFNKLQMQPRSFMNTSDVWSMIISFTLALGSLICLIVFFVSKFRKSGLAAKIRARPKVPLSKSR